MAILGYGLENAYNTYQALGYPMPTPEPIQAYVVPIQAMAPGITLPNWIYLTNEVGPNASALAAHEFFHSVQWVYQAGCPTNAFGVSQAWWDFEDLRWWMEATAEWGKVEAIVGDTSYTSGILWHWSAPWQRLYHRAQAGDNGAYAYSTLFPYYLIEKLNPVQSDKDIIRRTWSEYQQTGSCGAMLPVIDRTLPSNKSITGIFPDYAEASYFLAFPTPDIRAAMQTLPAPRPSDERPAHKSFNLSEQFLTQSGSANGDNEVQPLASSYVEFNSLFSSNERDKHRQLNITIHIPSANLQAEPVANVWLVTQYPVSPNLVPTSSVVLLTLQNGEYTGSVSIPDFDKTGLRWVGMELVNPATTGGNINNSRFEAEVIAPTPIPTNTCTPTPTSTFTPTLTNWPVPTLTVTVTATP